jgi:hypothetical protein
LFVVFIIEKLKAEDIKGSVVCLFKVLTKKSSLFHCYVVLDIYLILFHNTPFVKIQEKDKHPYLSVYLFVSNFVSFVFDLPHLVLHLSLSLTLYICSASFLFFSDLIMCGGLCSRAMYAFATTCTICGLNGG